MTDDPHIVAPDPAGDAPVPAVIGIAPLPGARRTPHLLVHVRVGPVIAVYAVAGLKRRQMQLRAPLAVNGAAGIMWPDDLQAAVEHAVFEAVRARPDLRRHLLHRG